MVYKNYQPVRSDVQSQVSGSAIHSPPNGHGESQIAAADKHMHGRIIIPISKMQL